jgi:multicomponent Na+:H+ antiporter subunit B
MNEQLVIRVMIRSLMPVLLIAACYLFWHSEERAGGAFQAGALLATTWILHRQTTIPKKNEYSTLQVIRIAAAGLLGIICVGLLSSIMNKEFLNYRIFSVIDQSAFARGIVLFEIGILIVVTASIIGLYMAFEQWQKKSRDNAL